MRCTVCKSYVELHSLEGAVKSCNCSYVTCYIIYTLSVEIKEHVIIVLKMIRRRIQIYVSLPDVNT